MDTYVDQLSLMSGQFSFKDTRYRLLEAFDEQTTIKFSQMYKNIDCSADIWWTESNPDFVGGTWTYIATNISDIVQSPEYKYLYKKSSNIHLATQWR